jgi:hypothetical protein
MKERTANRMRYEEDQTGLSQLIQNLEPVPGTWPPVYLHEHALIGYDKDGQVKIIAIKKIPTRTVGWRDKAYQTLGRVLIGRNFRSLMESQIRDEEKWTSNPTE